MNCPLDTNIVSLAMTADARVLAKLSARRKLQVGW